MVTKLQCEIAELYTVVALYDTNSHIQIGERDKKQSSILVVFVQVVTD